jgi:hypothetical protein
MSMVKIFDPKGRAKLAKELDEAEASGDAKAIARLLPRYRAMRFRFKDGTPQGPRVRLVKFKPLSPKQQKHLPWLEKLIGGPLKPRLYSLRALHAAMLEAQEELERCRRVRTHLEELRANGQKVTSRHFIDAVADVMAAATAVDMIEAKVKKIEAICREKERLITRDHQIMDALREGFSSDER